MSRAEIQTTADLYAVKRQFDLDEVIVHTGGIKTRGLLRYGLKYALWALRPGGRLTVLDNGPNTFDILPYRVPFPMVRQQVFKVIGADAELVELDPVGLRIVLERRRPVLAAGWSAGVLFSGNATEVPAIRRCLDALYRQPELQAKSGGQVMVCGPAAARDVLAGYPDAEYHPYENAEGPRNFTTRKKNALAAAARNPRVAIMHARMLLADGCLAGLPREFDVLTPRVEYHGDGVKVPYLDWMTAPALEGDGMPRGLPAPYNYDRSKYLDLLRSGMQPYIDGGLFMARTELLRQVPINPQLAWGEAEDTEWCARLHAAGSLVDIDPSVLATSQSFKSPGYFLKYPSFASLTVGAKRLVKLGLYTMTRQGQRR